MRNRQTAGVIPSSIERRSRRRQRCGFAALFLAAATVIWLSVAASAQAQSALCVRFFEDEDWGGSEWSFNCGAPRPSFDDWNDEITSIIVPDGYKLIAYEDARLGGASKEFIGPVPNVGGDFNDVISSWTLEPFDASPCVVAYQHANYGGESWYFCPAGAGLAPAPSDRWNDEISSLKVPDGNKVKVCVGVTHDDAGRPAGTDICRSYFRDVPFVGSLNDEVSFIQWDRFNRDNFFMVIMSDPQFGYQFCNTRDGGPCADHPNGTTSTRQANSWHVRSMKKMSDRIGFGRFAGFIANGDLTNTEDPRQLDRYIGDYERTDTFNIWHGLGNHDYDNYADKNCGFLDFGLCTIRMFDFLTNRIDGTDTVSKDFTQTERRRKNRTIFDREGSFAYSWDVGDFHFIQLHNHPAYERKISVDRHGSVEVRQSLAWLEEDIRRAGWAKKIIVNLHVMSTDSVSIDRFQPDPPEPGAAYPDTTAEFLEFQKILGRHANVVAIFAGHIHSWAGRKSYDARYRGPGLGITTKIPSAPGATDFVDGRRVPVFFSGSAEYNKFLLVEFAADRLEVSIIDSTGGNDPCGAGRCDGIVDVDGIEWQSSHCLFVGRDFQSYYIPSERADTIGDCREIARRCTNQPRVTVAYSLTPVVVDETTDEPCV